MTATGETVTVSRLQRDSILGFASSLLPRPGRTPEAVLAMARPLLEYAAQAAGDYDLRARMNSMHQASRNDRDQLRTPQEFLAEAAAYYDFITAETA